MCFNIVIYMKDYSVLYGNGNVIDNIETAMSRAEDQVSRYRDYMEIAIIKQETAIPVIEAKSNDGQLPFDWCYPDDVTAYVKTKLQALCHLAK